MTLLMRLSFVAIAAVAFGLWHESVSASIYVVASYAFADCLISDAMEHAMEDEPPHVELHTDDDAMRYWGIGQEEWDRLSNRVHFCLIHMERP